MESPFPRGPGCGILFRERATVYTAIEGARKTAVWRGIHERHRGLNHFKVRGDMAYLDNFAGGWELSPPKRNPDDVGFDELEDDPVEEEEDDEDDDLEDEEEDDDEEDRTKKTKKK